jgi:hypothetical protein
MGVVLGVFALVVLIAAYVAVRRMVTYGLFLGAKKGAQFGTKAVRDYKSRQKPGGPS